MKVPFTWTLGLGYAAVGLAAGVVSGLFGVGGGILMVPAAILLFGREAQTAVGTSLLVIIPTALVGTIRHWGYHNVDVPLAVGLCFGSMVGAYAIGAPLAERLQAGLLEKLFGVLMILVGLRMLGVFELVGSLFGLGQPGGGA
jgi:hypothetical protein